MQKSMDIKLDDIRSNADSKEFIICYAADADMGGIRSIGGSHPSLQVFEDELVDLVRQEKLDILLTSVSVMDRLARDERLFDESPMTPAIRAIFQCSLQARPGSRLNCWLRFSLGAACDDRPCR